MRTPYLQILPFPSCHSFQSSMDSYNFHFERMSNVDLHHLSLPVSRLSPAKSNGSIVDQLAHHQHGKGDSAYSSFSGGSTAPDYPSPFLPEDLQSNSFSHYADLKYVKSIYHPTQVLQSDSKTMDQLYRSVEAISQQYCNTNTNVNHLNHNGTDGVHTNNQTLLKREMQLGSSVQSSYPHIRPPPVPARLDSFTATKNLENIHHHSSEFQLQQPQQKARPQIRQPHDLNALKSESANADTGNSSFSSDPVYPVWRSSQQQQAQVPPSYRPHLLPKDQARVPLNPESLSIKENKAASEQQKSANNLSRSIPQGTSQPEHLTPKKPLSSGGSNGDQYSKANNRHLESQCKKAHSAQDWLDSEPARAASPWGNAGQSLISSSSIQHKGQYYFVTGVWKLSESGLRTHSVSVCGSEAGSEVSTVLETHKLRERSHSTMDNLFRPLQEGSRSSSGTIPDEREVFTSVTQEKDFINRSLDQENHRPSLKLTQSPQSFDTLEEIDSMQNREIGRHTASNPIFYCGPDGNCSPQSTTPTKEVTSLIRNEQSSHHKRDNHAKRGKWQPLGDVASERINKETTPLLYHLTGANRAALQPKNDPGLNIKGKEIVLNKTGQGDAPVNDSETPLQGDISKNNRGDDISVACNTLDDSFKKYYKEKLKDAQSKVLRETSFKRRDLQLSWPNRIRQKPELRPAVIHSFSSSQDSETSTDTLTPSVTSEGMEKGSIKGENISDQTKLDKKTENENGRPVNVAQPQVARIRGRKRLTPEQKKMCYSEPEKLNQLGGAPNHSACRSFGNENDDLFAVQYEGEEQMPREEQGLVEARRKMFETRGRALSASNVLKTNLRHLRHQALVEYMERKTGQKVAEPQQPPPQIPPPPRQRHSLGEKPFDWLGPRPLLGNHEVKNAKKLNRPHSAGRILDSSTSSIRYAQFFSAQSCSGQYAGQQNQSRWRESQGPSQGKSASAESLLDQPEQPSFFRNRSTSTPHELQANDYEEDLLPANTMETSSSQKNALQESLGKPAPVDHKQVRMVSQRGKSMEELGASQLTKLPALSKSSEQLDHLWRYSSETGGSDRDKRSVSNSAEEREAQGQERKRKKQSVSEQMGKEPEIVGQKHTQGQQQNQTQRKSLSKQNSESREDATIRSRNSSGSISPVSFSSSQAKVHPATPGSHGPFSDEFRSSKLPSETSSNPPSPRGLEITEREIKSTSSTPTQKKIPCENRSRSSRSSTSSVTGSEREQCVDEPSSDGQPLDSNHEVSLSCGITTDPSLWILPSEKEMEEEVKTSPLTDSVFDSTSSVPLKQMIETSVSPCTSISDADISHQSEEEKNPEIQGENVGENQEMEERGAPEGEMQGQETPAERPKWEELVEAVVKTDQSLARVLYPLANRKTALMLMEQLLSEDTLLMEEHYKKKQEQKAAESAETVEESDPCPRPPASDSQIPQGADLQSEADITQKKRLLVSYIEARLHSLEEMRAALLVEVQENTARGEALQVLVREHCLPVELERYNLFIGDLERVVSLLLCLSARLARVQNALTTVDQNTDAEEKQSLDSRHRLLCKQREDAKDLKDNLDRRENLVSTFLSRQLSTEQLQNYRCFVQTKASLLIRQKDLEEKQRLGEEQLEALTNSLDL